MKLEYDSKSLDLSVNDQNTVRISSPKVYPYAVLVNNLGYRDVSLEYDKMMITKKCIEDYYLPVDDFFFVEFSKSKKQLVGYNQVYKSKKFDYFILLDIDLQTKYAGEEIYKEGVYKIINMYYTTNNPENAIKSFRELNELSFIDDDSSSKISIVLKTPTGFNFKEHYIKPLDINVDIMYNDSFKPVHEKVVDKLLNTNKGIIMFHGDAGTGKTNYIKHLTKLVPKKKFVFITSSMIPYLTDPSFLGELIENKGSVLVLEDCETYLKDRDQTNMNNVVSSILNLSDGILSDVLGIQIICTFNTNLSNIDKALLRKGRLISEYKFEKLELTKTNALLETLGFGNNNESMTLTDIFNFEEVVHKSQKETKKIGF